MVNGLIKEYQSFGGIKVKPFKQSHKINKKEYLQKFIDGDSISVQFFVENNNIKILAICDQIITNSEMVFFYLKA